MTEPSPLGCADTAVEQLLEHLYAGRLTASYTLVDEALGSGWDIEAVVTDLLAEVQRRVGEQWQSGSWTITAEHAATAVIDDLLGSIGGRVAAPTREATIALGCAEGEWHATPARMAALLLRDQGWRTIFLGASTPTPHLVQELRRTQPTFVAISCTHLLALQGAARIAQACRDIGIPTIAGGRAFGSEPQRALHLGFDGWAQDPRSASAILEGWLDEPPTPPASSTQLPAPSAADERLWASLTERTLQQLANAVPAVRDDRAAPLDAVREDLSNLLRTAHLAAMCDDPTVFRDYLTWLTGIRPARGLPHAAILPSVAIMLGLDTALRPQVRAILASVGSGT